MRKKVKSFNEKYFAKDMLLPFRFGCCINTVFLCKSDCLTVSGGFHTDN